MNKFSQDVKAYINEASEILKRKADDIARDFDEEKVNEVYITLRIDVNDVPSLEIQRTYIPFPSDATGATYITEKAD